MRNVQVISVSLPSDMAIELKRFAFDHFDNNFSRMIVWFAKTSMPKYIQEREELIKKWNTLNPDPTPEEKQERIKQEEQDKELAERKRKSKEYKTSLRVTQTDPEVERIKSDPNNHLWEKHYREIRLNPDNHNPYDCYWCKLYPDLMRICTERG